MLKSWVSFVIIIVPLFFTIYLSTVENITAEIKILCWVIFAVICLYVYVNGRIEKKEKDQEKKVVDQKFYLAQRHDLFHQGMPMAYIDGLGENPLFEHSFNKAKKLEKESKFNQAIIEYQKCLSHPKASDSNMLASHILIGNCYYSLSQLKDAEKHYKQALAISKTVKDKNDKLQGKSAALGNIGLIYSDLGKPDEALQYHQQALEIFKRIKAQPQIDMTLENIEIIKNEMSRNKD